MKTVNVSVDILRESVHIGDDAAALAEKVAADQTAVESKVPLVVDSLVSNGIIDEMQKDATAELLKDAPSALDVIAKLAKQASQPRSMGSAVAGETKSAGNDPQFPAEKESDRVFRETLGAATP